LKRVGSRRNTQSLTSSRSWVEYHIADAIQEFLTGSRAPVESDRVLATVLFTDIVGSTEKAASLGDSRWRKLVMIITPPSAVTSAVER
jgi:class 3 adenylate cyclase